MILPRPPCSSTRPSPGAQPTTWREIPSLKRSLAALRTEILQHHHTDASNGPTEGLNLCVKKLKRCATAFEASSTTACACSSTPVA
jgi:hypothetical protein